MERSAAQLISSLRVGLRDDITAEPPVELIKRVCAVINSSPDEEMLSGSLVKL